jgi:hypothetical protein
MFRFPPHFMSPLVLHIAAKDQSPSGSLESFSSNMRLVRVDQDDTSKALLTHALIRVLALLIRRLEIW